MIRVLIIEDEKLAAKRLEELILTLEPGIKILAVLDTVRDSISWLKNKMADLVFMDIHLSDGNSFEIFEHVEVKTPVIFTTAYDEYALKAFRVNSIDYLLKPFSPVDVRKAMEKYHSYFSTPNDGPDIESLIKMLKPDRKYQSRFLITAGSIIKSISIEEISYFYNLEKSNFICTSAGKNYASGLSLDKIELLVDPDLFFRINRNFLISYKSIRNIYNLSKSRIKIDVHPPQEDQDILVSFNKSAEFRQWLGKITE
ncbi:MAG: response regulator transcription factor [Bacteroidales bacterium]|nr:response regulator transcription factor [Bacteroidales bacterium]MCB8999378.1 response regulator transcription factor [Bacteroidales bacterium]MCB9013379.1 response regulator transcription factor [Bacteroidales bacterium]